MKCHCKAADFRTAATGFSTRRFYATFAPPLTVWAETLKIASPKAAMVRRSVVFMGKPFLEQCSK